MYAYAHYTSLLCFGFIVLLAVEGFHRVFLFIQSRAKYGRAVPSTRVARACSIVLKTNLYANFYTYLLANCSNQ